MKCTLLLLKFCITFVVYTFDSCQGVALVLHEFLSKNVFAILFIKVYGFLFADAKVSYQ